MSVQEEKSALRVDGRRARAIPAAFWFFSAAPSARDLLFPFHASSRVQPLSEHSPPTVISSDRDRDCMPVSLASPSRPTGTVHNMSSRPPGPPSLLQTLPPCGSPVAALRPSAALRSVGGPAPSPPRLPRAARRAAAGAPARRATWTSCGILGKGSSKLLRSAYAGRSLRTPET